MNPDELSQWNAMAYSGGEQTGALSPYNMPTADEISSSSIVDSSGNSLSLGNVLQAGGSFLGAFGDIMVGDQTAAADNYNAQLALEQGQFSVDDLNLREADMLSTQKAMYAKAGVTMSGSPLDTAFNTATQFERDKQIATYNAQSKANMYQYEGQVAQAQAQFKSGQDMLSGATQLAEGAGLLALAL